MGFSNTKANRVILGILFVCVLYLHRDSPSFVNAKAADAAAVAAFVKLFAAGGKNITYAQVVKWFDEQRAATRGDTFKFSPRLWPFCVTSAQIRNKSMTSPDSKIYQFRRIIQSLELSKTYFYQFNKTIHSSLEEKKWVLNMDISRINTPELDMVNLRQWIHVKIETAPVLGLLVQNIVGPLGLPFGEFFLDFPCQDDIENTRDIDVVGELHPCSYRSKASLEHPLVYVGVSQQPRTSWHFHFHWTDITCSETPYIQFIMILAKQFVQKPKNPSYGEDFKAIFSPIFLNTDFDSKDGAPYPYHPSMHDKMYCFIPDSDSFNKKYQELYGSAFPSTHVDNDPRFAPIDFKVTSDIWRIQPNEVYDACVAGKDPGNRDDTRRLCPPGPFRCDQSYSDIAAKDPEAVLKERELQVQNEKNTTDCFPCGAPECLASGFPKEHCEVDILSFEESSQNETYVLENTETAGRTKSHGIMALFGFLVLLPIANFMARFYKEMCINFLCGNGPWLFVHVVVHMFATLIIWISTGPVASALADQRSVIRRCHLLHKGDNKAKLNCIYELSADSPHVITGILAFILHQFLMIFGFWRSSSNKLRFVQVALHSHVGYITFLLAGVSAILTTASHNCAEMLAFTILLFVVPIIFTCIGVVLDLLTDKAIGISPMRRQWPVLEPLKVEGRGPLHWPKVIILCIFVGIMLLVWLLAVGSTTVTTYFVSDEVLENATASSFLGGIVPTGLFGQSCGGKLGHKDSQKHTDASHHTTTTSSTTGQPQADERGLWY